MRFILRRDSLEKWNTNNPILMNAEVAIVEEDGFKSLVIGDGEHRFQELPRVKLQKGVSVMMGLYPNGKFRFHAIEDNLEKEEEKEVMGENYIVINGKKAELTEEQLKTLGITPEKKNPFDIVELGDHYYCTGTLNDIICLNYKDDAADRKAIEACNHFNNKDVAMQVHLHQVLYRKLLKFAYDNECEDAAACDGIIKHHYTIFFNTATNAFAVTELAAAKYFGVRFSTRRGAERAIKEIVIPFVKDHPDFVW